MDVIGTAISVLTFFGLYLILAIGLNLEFGFTGQPNFGVVAFFGLGCLAAAYVSNLIMIGVLVPPSQLVPATLTVKDQIAASSPLIDIFVFAVAITVSVAIAGIGGYLASYPALKLRGDYLAIILLAFGEMLRTTCDSFSFCFGTVGSGGIPNPLSWASSFERDAGFMMIVLIIGGIAFFYSERLVNSPLGRVLKSVRDDDTASASMGKNVSRIRGQVMFIGSALCGVSGALYAMFAQFVVADDWSINRTFDVWLIMMIGGVANNQGMIVGALLLWILDRAMSIGAMATSSIGGLPFDPVYLRYVITGIIMLFVVVYKPKGLISEKSLKSPALEKLYGPDKNA